MHLVNKRKRRIGNGKKGKNKRTKGDLRKEN